MKSSWVRRGWVWGADGLVWGPFFGGSVPRSSAARAGKHVLCVRAWIGWLPLFVHKVDARAAAPLGGAWHSAVQVEQLAREKEIVVGSVIGSTPTMGSQRGSVVWSNRSKQSSCNAIYSGHSLKNKLCPSAALCSCHTVLLWCLMHLDAS